MTFPELFPHTLMAGGGVVVAKEGGAWGGRRVYTVFPFYLYLFVRAWVRACVTLDYFHYANLQVCIN